MSGTSKYRSEIDGLRAIAVLTVVFFHARFGFTGGYVGVDVFFVISGFLITGIIIKAIENKSFSLVEFWERRVRRIFPALFVAVATTLLVGYWVLLPNELVHLAKTAIAQALLVANVFFWNEHHGYFGVRAEFKPLLHTWSLALEEQFYLFFPLLLVLFRNQSRKRIFWAVAVFTGASFTLCVYMLPHYAGTTFFLLPTRAWELLAGCLLALAPWEFRSRPRFDSSVGLAGLIAILYSAVFYDSNTPFPGFAAIPPVLGTVAILYATAATPNTLTQRLLSLRPLTFVGLISYSMYLWHWPILVFLRLYSEEMGFKQILTALCLAFVAAVLSWQFVEQPFRHRSLLKSRGQLFGTALAMTAVTILGCFVFVNTNGMPSRYSDDSKILISDITWYGNEFETPLDVELQFNAIPTLGVEDNRDDSRLDFVLWGDSHGMLFSSKIDEIAKKQCLKGKSIVTSSVPAMPNVCLPFNRKISGDDSFRVLRQWFNALMSNTSTANPMAAKTLRRQEEVVGLLKANPPRNLIVICRWAYYTDGHTELEGGPDSSHLLSDDAVSFSTLDSPRDVMSRSLHYMASFCEENDIQLWIVKQVPETNELQPARDLFLWSIGRRANLLSDRSTLEEHRIRQAQVNAIFHSISSPVLHLVELAPYVFDEDGFTINYDQERAIYRDNNHLTAWGLDRVEEPIEDMLRTIKLQREKGS